SYHADHHNFCEFLDSNNMTNLKSYFESLMNDKKKGFLSGILKAILWGISAVYALLVTTNHFLYRIGFLKTHKVPVTVISIGNITLGGTGKTPFAIMLARKLHNEGRKTALLIRGYGDDEWKMMSEKLEKKGIGIFVGKDRVKSAKEALVLGASDIILDDGFQHRRLMRDLNIVLIDSMNPFGNRHLFPRGILREPISSLKKADVIVFTKAEEPKFGIGAIEEELKNKFPGKIFMKATHAPKDLCGVYDRKVRSISDIKGKTVCLVSAICAPSYFRYTAEKCGLSVGLEFTFPDHYLYREKDLKRICGECAERKIDIILTTDKDAVKLKNLQLPDNAPGVLALTVEFEIIEGKGNLDAALHRLHSRNFRQNN
ncbi:MAG: tetraacyldisaccharide 4'-kinase, partial [Candidatus Omnitrophota bacterium]